MNTLPRTDRESITLPCTDRERNTLPSYSERHSTCATPQSLRETLYIRTHAARRGK